MHARPLVILLALACAALLSQPLLGAGPPAKISDLSWLTGSYEGAMGPGATLEENWAEAKAGSIAALVRSTANDATTMIELIVDVCTSAVKMGFRQVAIVSAHGHHVGICRIAIRRP